jgi:two-component system, sensor histidine kinase PdtaS
MYELIISDDGVGIPKDLKYFKTETLGLKLVNSLVNQLNGAIELDRTHGTKFIILFPELEYKKRI